MLAVVCAVVVVLAGVGRPSPAGRPAAPAAPASSAPFGTGCHAPLVTCHGRGTSTVAMWVPMTWRLPAGWPPVSGSGANRELVETYFDHGGHQAGLTMMERVLPARRSGSPAAVAGVPPGARAFALWLAGRPFLDASPVRTTKVDGRRAWTLDAKVRPRAGTGPALCASRFRCFPVTIQPTGNVTGMWDDMTSRYTVLDVPGAGTVVAWAWVFGPDRSALDQASRVVAGLRFGR